MANIDISKHPLIIYRQGSSDIATPVLRGTGIRVETIVVANRRWGQSVDDLAREYEIPVETVQAALDYYQAHPEEIDILIRIEQEIEAHHSPDK